jgi:hypothetical protein
MINVFYHVDASAFLIPSRFVERPFTDNEPSFDLITEWAEKLETSLTATAFRFARFTSEPVAIVYSVRGVIQYFQPSVEFVELGVFPDVKGPVGRETDAWKLFKGMDTRDQWRNVRASEWFREDSVQKTEHVAQ